MTRLSAWIRSFFGFSRTETNAFLILLPLMVLLIFSEPAYRYWFVRRPRDFSNDKKELDSLMATWKWEESDSVVRMASEEKLFSFDPNLATREELAELGFHHSIANRIVNYRLKGGKFVWKKDLMKIYGMDSVLCKKLLPFIDLPEKSEKPNEDRKFEPKEKPIIKKFDLNTADTSRLIKIHGIGPKLSRRIVIFREKLGGFTSLVQLKEVYGLDSTVIHELVGKSFIDENFRPRLIEINKATERELANHPYINYKLAKAITTYRFQHGLYRTVDELKKIAIIDEVNFQKIKPYLSANP
jgi:competence protein ComEA